MRRTRRPDRGRWKGLARHGRGGAAGWRGLIGGPCSVRGWRTKEAVAFRAAVRTDGPTLFITAGERGPEGIHGLRRHLARTPAGIDAVSVLRLAPGLETPARRILETIRPALGRCEAAIELGLSEIVSGVSPGPRCRARTRLGTLEVRIGPASDRPAWARSLVWPAPLERPPVDRLAALVRMCRIHARVVSAPGTGAEPDWRDPGLAVAMTADAGADLLRLASRRWEGARRGTRVGPATLELHGAGAGGLETVRPPERGEALVVGGRLTGRATAPPRVPDGSWREAPRRGWPLLVARSRHRTDLPDGRVCLLAGVIPLGRLLWGRGAWCEDGTVRAGWGPSPIPGADWWVRRMEAAWSDPLIDAGGVPVACPGFVAPGPGGDR